MEKIDLKIKELMKLNDSFIFIEYYTHTNQDMYKILKTDTEYREEKLVLFSVEEGFEKSLDEAIRQLKLN